MRAFVLQPGDAVPGRLCSYWLLATMTAAILLHLQQLPVWLLAVSAGLLAFRWWQLRQGRPDLRSSVRTGLAILGLLGFALINGRTFTVETAIGFFILTYSLKALELVNRRDTFIFAFLSLFLMALAFLFGQDLWTAMLVFSALLLPLQALRTLQEGSAEPFSGLHSLTASLGATLRLAGLAVPLLVLMYLLFPRLDPLWSMPLKARTGFTGLSDTMSPGEIANLAGNADRAFTVTFAGKSPPPAAERYWQAMILDEFDGLGWRRSAFQQRRDALRDFSEQRSAPVPTTAGRAGQGWSSPGMAAAGPESYEVVVQPHNQQWGFTLGYGRVRSGPAAVTRDDLVRFHEPVTAARRYRMERITPSVPVLTPSDRERLTRLGAGNDATRRWAQALTQALPASEPQRLQGVLAAMLNYLHEEPFRYTLQPPLLEPGNRIDRFLFGTRAGFCEHYASSIAWALRSVGYPARVMTGYQGGEWNGSGNFLTVRQYEAHAWVEVYVEEQGWRRVDPTAAVHPQRIELGMRMAMGQDAGFLAADPVSLERYGDWQLVDWVRGRLDYTNFLWQQWVVNYDSARQISWFSRWFDGDRTRIFAGLLGLLTIAVVAVLAVLALASAVQRRHETGFQKLLRHFYRKLHGAGITDAHERLTLTQIERKLLAGHDSDAEAAIKVVRRLQYLMYQSTEDPDCLPRAELRTLQRSIRRLQLGRRKSPG